MAKAPSKTAKDRGPDAESSSIMAKAFGSDKSDVQSLRISEVANILKLFPEDDKEARRLKIFSASQVLVDLEPKDELERMLIVQMIGVHAAAVECYRRAMIDEQTFAGRDNNLKHAEKLSAVYAKQLETLNKHRGKGQQNITVKHVNVAAGGQAIVGNVNAGESASKQNNQMLTDDTEVPIDVTPSRKRSKPKSGK